MNSNEGNPPQPAQNTKGSVKKRKIYYFCPIGMRGLTSHNDFFKYCFFKPFRIIPELPKPILHWVWIEYCS